MYVLYLACKRHNFLKKCTWHEICLLIFSTLLSETFLNTRECSNMFSYIYSSSCESLLFVRIDNKLEFSRQLLLKPPQIPFCEKLSSGGQTVVCDTDMQTDITKWTATFCNPVNVPKKKRHSNHSDYQLQDFLHSLSLMVTSITSHLWGSTCIYK